MALALAQSGNETGTVRVTARSDGLQDAQLEIPAVRAQ
jgi:hypothetical protein